jgi:uncharacterized protein (DUF433 family)
MAQFDRITHQAGVMSGKACIRGMRVTVDNIVRLAAAGRSPDHLLQEYPYLEPDDIAQALAYAEWRKNEQEVPLA